MTTEKLPTALFSISTKLPYWQCHNEDCKEIFVILINSQLWAWGNPDKPPYCPHCGQKLDSEKQQPINEEGE
jgi:hypothetical protein